MLERLFLNTEDWQHRDGAFYRCSLCDVSKAIPANFIAQILTRMREITGLPLIDRVLVTAQKMLPGQDIGIHSDRPFLGYEIARLVVQLNEDWKAEHGGVLQLFGSPEGEVMFSVNPVYNIAFAFLLHEKSYHAVTKVTQPRHSLVFNFWHAANTPELESHIKALFANLNFSHLPTSLDLVATEAELNLPEQITLLAGTAAIALQRWGYDEATIEVGYLHSAGISLCDSRDNYDTETYAAVLLANWVAFLYRDSFDLTRWNDLQSKLAGLESFPRLLPIWRHCLPQ